jgi:hypothetical protein
MRCVTFDWSFKQGIARSENPVLYSVRFAYLRTTTVRAIVVGRRGVSYLDSETNRRDFSALP